MFLLVPSWYCNYYWEEIISLDNINRILFLDSPFTAHKRSTDVLLREQLNDCVSSFFGVLGLLDAVDVSSIGNLYRSFFQFGWLQKIILSYFKWKLQMMMISTFWFQCEVMNHLLMSCFSSFCHLNQNHDLKFHPIDRK